MENINFNLEQKKWTKAFDIDDNFEQEISKTNIPEDRKKRGNILQYKDGPVSKLSEKEWKVLYSDTFRNKYGNLSELAGRKFVSADKLINHLVDNIEGVDLNENLGVFKKIQEKNIFKNFSIIFGSLYRDINNEVENGQSYDCTLKGKEGEEIEPENLIIEKMVYVKPKNESIHAQEFQWLSHELIHALTSHVIRMEQFVKNKPELEKFLYPEEKEFFMEAKNFYEEFIIMFSENQSSEIEFQKTSKNIKNGDWDKIPYWWSFDEVLARTLQIEISENEKKSITNTIVLKNGKSLKRNFEECLNKYIDFLEKNPNRISDYTQKTKHLIGKDGDPLVKIENNSVYIGSN